MHHIFKLTKAGLVARGSQRAVYLHPLDGTKLVKIRHPSLSQSGLRKPRNNLSAIMDYYFPSRQIKRIHREYVEYIRLILNNLELRKQIPISHMMGFVFTNLGMGCLTEQVMSRDGSIGETLHSKINSGTLTVRDINLLNDTIKRIYTCGLRILDLNSKNFVFGYRDNGISFGPEECVLVDGFGEHLLIPFLNKSRATNKMMLNIRFKRLAIESGLKWDQKSKTMARR